MRPVLHIDHSAIALKDTTHLQTVLKVLGAGEILRYDSDREDRRGRICYYSAPSQREIIVEMVSEDRIRPVKTEKAIEPEIIEEEQVTEIDIATRRRRPKRKAQPAPKNSIDARSEFERMRLAAGTAGQLLLGEGSV